VRDMLRNGATDEQLLDVLRGVWLDRSDRYSEIRSAVRESENANRKVEMFYIGG